mmetsp:Transcript_100521/g.183744  ORF Transcript_100521/g.183744 Transcript_100521/m.183744 type:complete len:475 (-) Transcript_100521:99-1523(-)
MPEIVPANFSNRAGVKETAHTYEETWVNIPFETYEGMTQSLFQQSTGVYGRNGAKITLNVPKGWRRVETPYAGKHIYVNMETGVISKAPKDVYNCRKDCWVKPDGMEMPDAEIMMDPYAYAMKQGEGDAPGTMKAVEEEAVVKKVTAAPATVAATPAPAVDGPSLPVCLMFPGQGSQYVKMMAGVKDIPAVQEMLKTAKMVLGMDILDLCLKGPEAKLEETRYCQPAMFIAGLAGVEKLKGEKLEAVTRAQVMAGLSLGEYTALCAAGVFSFKDGLELVKLRGEAMQEAAAVGKQAMLSVAGIEKPKLTQLCADAAKKEPKGVCQIANELFPKGFSCAGTEKAVMALKELAEQNGALQAKVLKTSGGFHTDLMAPAAEKLGAKLDAMLPSMSPPTCTIFMNANAKPIAPGTDPKAIVALLKKQLTSPVLWEPSVRGMIKEGVTEFYEVGPMKQIKAMMKRIDPKVWGNTTNVDV